MVPQFGIAFSSLWFTGAIAIVSRGLKTIYSYSVVNYSFYKMGYNPQKLFIRFYKSITWRAPYQYLVETCVPNADRVRRPAPKQRHGPQRLPPGAASGRHKGAQVEGVEAKGGGGQGLEAEKWGLGQEIFYIFLGGCSREFW